MILLWESAAVYQEQDTDEALFMQLVKASQSETPRDVTFTNKEELFVYG